MPNWCEGTLKVRGKFENIKRFCKEVFQVWDTKFDPENGFVEVQNKEAITIETDTEDEFWMRIERTAYIKGTHRNFIESNNVECYPSNIDNTIVFMEFKAAWDIEAEPYIKLSQEYGVDIRIYGFERGQEFNRELIVENGHLVKNEEITYSDYYWECPMPLMGG